MQFLLTEHPKNIPISLKWILYQKIYKTYNQNTEKLHDHFVDLKTFPLWKTGNYEHILTIKKTKDNFLNQITPNYDIKKQASSHHYYLLSGSFDMVSKLFHMAAGIMSTLAILSPSLSLIASAPLVFLPSVRIWT